MDTISIPEPEIDFSENIVICVFMGRCPSAGYRVSIKGIWREGDHIRVELVEYSPGNSTLVAQVLTRPYVFASLDAADVPVIFGTSVSTQLYQDPLIPERFSLTAFVIVFLASVIAVAALARKPIKRQ